MPNDARYGVGYAWLVDPLKQTLEAYALEEGGWRQLGTWGGAEIVAVPPFDAVQLALRELWTLADDLSIPVITDLRPVSYPP